MLRIVSFCSIYHPNVLFFSHKKPSLFKLDPRIYHLVFRMFHVILFYIQFVVFFCLSCVLYLLSWSDLLRPQWKNNGIFCSQYENG